MKLYEIDEAYATALGRAAKAAEENEGELPDYLATELDLLEDARERKITSVAKYIKNLNAECDAISGEAKKLLDRADSKAGKAKHLKSYLAQFLGVGEKYEDETVALSWRHSESVNIPDMDKLSGNYIKTRTTHSADKVAIKKAIKAGTEVEGATLVESNSLQIK